MSTDVLPYFCCSSAATRQDQGQELSASLLFAPLPGRRPAEGRWGTAVARPLFRGDRLRGAREAARLSREDLALALGLSNASRIRVWEAGIEHPRPHFVPKLATVLGVEPLRLLDVDPDDPPLVALRMAAGRATTEMHAPGMSVMTYVRLEDGRPGAEPADAVITAVAAVLHVDEARVRSAVRRSRLDHAVETSHSS